MEPKGSLPCTQGPITHLNPDPDASSPHPPTLFLQDPVSYYPPSLLT
jgi:hypothetical protein